MIPLRGRQALEDYFAGFWLLSRRIIDRRSGLAGRLSGKVVFRPDAAGFIYEETGILTYGAYEGQASQSYHWDLDPVDGAAVRFRDGRLFHLLHLDRGAVAVQHLCAADLYRGRFRLVTDRCWLSRWQVRGPRKDQIILNRYRRATTIAADDCAARDGTARP
ncbi:MAG TPA: DUF6314 family protein [Terriglobia bacterium]|nr:DUF6314 family protein [Terriglobia bacterium]